MLMVSEDQSKQLRNEFKYLGSQLSKNGVITSDKIIESSFVVKKIFGNFTAITEELTNGYGYFLIRGIPALEDERLIELLVLGITYAIGFNPFAYRQEKDGQLVHDIKPISGSEKSVSSNGIVDFKFHADCAYLRRHLRPETLSLFCLNNDSNTSTNIVNIDQIVSHLTLESVNILALNRYIHIPPETFKVGSKITKGSILDKVDGNWEIKVATHNCQAIDDLAKQALVELSTAADTVKQAHKWIVGDFLIFNNLRCLHGRGMITGDRWLKRCYGSSNHKLAEVLDLSQINIK